MIPLISSKFLALTLGSIQAKNLMTITEKILARGSERYEVRPGKNGWVDADILMINDITFLAYLNSSRKKFGQNAKMTNNQFRQLDFIITIVVVDVIYMLDEELFC